MFRAAAIQMCSSADVDGNLTDAKFLIQQAAKDQARLIVLPENFAFMGMQDADRLAVKEELGRGKIQNFIAQLAADLSVYIVAGTIPIISKDPQKVRATCLVFDPTGQIIHRYDKINLFDATVSKHESHRESTHVEPGNELSVVRLPFVNLGTVVCFDLRFPTLFSNLSLNQVEMIAAPSAFTVPTGQAHWHLLTRCRAIDTFSYVIAAAQGGIHQNNRKTFGHSLIVDPWGKILAEKNDDQPGFIVADINVQYAYECREAIPHLFQQCF